jgi:hypothetical protein
MQQMLLIRNQKFEHICPAGTDDLRNVEKSSHILIKILIKNNKIWSNDGRPADGMWKRPLSAAHMERTVSPASVAPCRR